MRLYNDLAWIWSAVTPADVYQEEAENLWEILCESLGQKPQNLLEFGCGGGYLASHLPKEMSLCLVDSSEAMLAESQRNNPEQKHILGDMLTVDCGELFDCVLVHDAVMYLRSREEALELLANCKKHLRPNGRLILVPDAVQETFYERTFTAKSESEYQGKAVSLVLTEWHWDRDANDDLVQVEFSILLRRNEEVEVVHESHEMLVLPLMRWMELFHTTGLEQTFPNPPWIGGGEFFLLHPQ